MSSIVKQYLITPSAGKRLIGKALVIHPNIKNKLKHGTIVIIAGTTNGYVAEEILTSIDQTDGFSRKNFFRGITLPPSGPTVDKEKFPLDNEFSGDIVIAKGVWKKGMTIFDIADELKEGDIILKGANAIDLLSKKAAIYIGHPKAGTIGVALQAIVGRRVQLIIPVGLEKRICGNIDDIAKLLNAPGAKGPSLLPVPGEIYTEIEAISNLTGAEAKLIAGGGVCGAEGCYWISVCGSLKQIKQADKIIESISNETLFNL